MKIKASRLNRGRLPSFANLICALFVLAFFKCGCRSDNNRDVQQIGPGSGIAGGAVTGGIMPNGARGGNGSPKPNEPTEGIQGTVQQPHAESTQVAGSTETPAGGSGPTTQVQDATIDPINDSGPSFTDGGTPPLPVDSSQPPPEIDCSASTLQPGQTNETIEIGGQRRSYILLVPQSYTGYTPVPLVIDWHPLLMTSSYQRGASGYAEIAQREGFIVAYPQGIDNAWNIGPCCTRSRDVDDLGLAHALVDRIKSQGCIDPKRVYATGFSMGGGMSHYLGCEAADVFAAVVPAAFDLIEENVCAPARPITVMSFRGTSDFIVPYAGGLSIPPTAYPLEPIHFLGAVGTFEKWAEINGCAGAPERTDIGPGCQTYTTCNEGVEVTLCTSASGHTQGNAELGWDMMKRHPMP